MRTASLLALGTFAPYSEQKMTLIGVLFPQLGGIVKCLLVKE